MRGDDVYALELFGGCKFGSAVGRVGCGIVMSAHASEEED